MPHRRLPLSFPFTSHGSTVFALHVADGSQIITRRSGGPSVSIDIGSGAERYGSCSSRLRAASLAGGDLPILQTAYTDANGVRYRRESFAGRVLGARSIVSFVRLEVDARRAVRASTLRLVTWRRLLRTPPARLGSVDGTRLIVSRCASLVDGAMRYRVPAGGTRAIVFAWLHAPVSRALPPRDADRVPRSPCHCRQVLAGTARP